MRDSIACTGTKSQWLMSSYVKEIPFHEVSEIDFTSAKRKDRLLRETAVVPGPTVDKSVQRLRKTPTVTNDEEEEFFNNIAKTSIKSVILSLHENLVLADSGLHIRQIWPYLGASSDNIVECNCCGKGAVEIKCPYKHKDVCLSEASMVDRTFCLEQKNGILSLKKSHQYYYQVQAQLYICDVDYCDFVVWTPKDIHIERIVPNDEFWADITFKATLFFVNGVLPELMITR
ncbi:hypothetical protein AWC38_SpisGene888 [Stylophora pistillata]|uniref:YqaJ viral recombinase domain-containing protein n=1 Tax=Stylophora pistillata TaxID=50429 RepID=A0A2B4T0Z3_STYPI|nr:hypothetical protein AWC38_SpisGene888 [Stylophora pistillata]